MFPWLHPTVVHFAVALVFAAVLFDVIALWRHNEKLLFAGFWNTILGAIGALAAVGSGFIAEANQEVLDEGASALLAFHKVFALTGAFLWVAVAIARMVMRGYIWPKARTVYLAASFFVLALVTVAGAIGGTLVYGYGVGVSPAAARRIVDLQDRTNGPSRPAAVQPVPKDTIAPAE